ncbi:expressed unknown protein [Seminavis robusta]|uniref:Uncharacterized protein n=1 Tax=Seminavis robusta TaxID=568900 RepID=A0A9N8DKH1_9STRA|nr:expressed unknown protein [Seminavis robusta]CAB9530368.1 expressed unknown protein [Seminavis robusta]|eukprot:Sro134_g063630.1 n/a (129) ;mRNA; f:105530-105916
MHDFPIGQICVRVSNDPLDKTSDVSTLGCPDLMNRCESSFREAFGRTAHKDSPPSRRSLFRVVSFESNIDCAGNDSDNRWSNGGRRDACPPSTIVTPMRLKEDTASPPTTIYAPHRSDGARRSRRRTK